MIQIISGVIVTILCVLYFYFCVIKKKKIDNDGNVIKRKRSKFEVVSKTIFKLIFLTKAEGEKFHRF